MIDTDKQCIIIKSCGANTCSGMSILGTHGPYTYTEANALLERGARICGEYKSNEMGYHAWEMGDYNETVYRIYDLDNSEEKIFEDARYEAEEFPQEEEEVNFYDEAQI